MPDQGFIPENIGSLTALMVSGTAAIILVYRKGGDWFKNSFSGIFSLAKIMLTLKEGHERNEKLLADHELRLRGVEWIKNDHESIHGRIKDHEHRIREHEHQLSEGAAVNDQIRREMSDLSESHQVLSSQLNQVMREVGSVSEQIKSLEKQGEKTSGQMDLLISHLLPPAH